MESGLELADEKIPVYEDERKNLLIRTYLDKKPKTKKELLELAGLIYSTGWPLIRDIIEEGFKMDFDGHQVDPRIKPLLRKGLSYRRIGKRVGGLTKQAIALCAKKYNLTKVHEKARINLFKKEREKERDLEEKLRIDEEERNRLISSMLAGKIQSTFKEKETNGEDTRVDRAVQNFIARTKINSYSIEQLYAMANMYFNAVDNNDKLAYYDVAKRFDVCHATVYFIYKKMGLSTMLCRRNKDKQN